MAECIDRETLINNLELLARHEDRFRRCAILGVVETIRAMKAADLIEAQAKEIEKLRGQLPRWIPVTERLPEYGVRVLATDMYEGDDYTGIRTREEYPDDADGCWYDEMGRWYAIDDVTHWMPLPKAPEVKKDG